MQKRWNILSTDTNKVIALQQALKINKTLCNILVQRGIDSFEKAKKYLDYRENLKNKFKKLSPRQKILCFNFYIVKIRQLYWIRIQAIQYI